MEIEYKSDNLKLEIDKDVPIGRLYISRPEKLNAITMAMRSEIVRFFDLIESDDRIRVVVIRGVAEGRGFSAGGDIPQFVTVPVPQLANLAYSMSAPERCTKPVIAVIDGHCYGGGLEFACSCDFRIATPAARFAFPEVTLGALPGSGGTQRAVRLMGVGRARAMVQTGRPIDAETAERWGLIAAVYDDAAFASEAQALALRMAKQPTRALAAIKRLVDASVAGEMDAQMAREAKAQTEVGNSRDTIEGIMAFIQKRDARFTGQ